MSLINKMLQELDRRHAPQSAGAPPGLAPSQTPQPVYAATRMVGSEWFWRVVAFMIVLAIAWIAWVAWQITPRGAVTELALQSVKRPAPTAAPAPVAVVPAAPAVPAPPAAPVPEASAPPASPGQATSPQTTPPQAAVTKAESDRPEMLKLALEIITPLKPRGARPAVAPPSAQAPSPASKQGDKSAPAPTSLDHLAKAATRGATEAALLQAGAPPASGQISKRDGATPRERAMSEYRRAVGFVNQGRMAEGMDAFRSALGFDPSYEAARQTQVALLLEAKRMDEAARLLQEGIALNPSNAAFVMLMARIMVERNDIGGALALLQQHAPAAGAANADYHAFAAALYQRLGRHGEAVTEYGAALRVAPASGVWWVGLGISQEAQQRSTEAADSFRRAKDTGTLSTELAGFVERKLKAQR
jgi:MSHA biogenesis protein MshN